MIWHESFWSSEAFGKDGRMKYLLTVVAGSGPVAIVVSVSVVEFLHSIEIKSC